METKFSFHPVAKIFLISDNYEAHAETIRHFNNNSRRFVGWDVIPFDAFIRGIFADGVLYLRTFYPLADIDDKTGEEITEKSFSLLYDAKSDILKAMKSAGIKKPKKICYNVTNAELKGILINI